ncbi:MAG: DUF262 domain-containing protein [Candidatus Nanoarchaeia archaeon]|nr:DUF262 domain-containing protein [Candidatus Nanoarchaeia archaeon]
MALEYDSKGNLIVPGSGDIDFSQKNTSSIKPERAGFLDLIREIEKGNLVIPMFQRGLVWNIKASISLLDSIYRGYPIGSFLFWETEKNLNYIKKIGDYQLNTPNEDAQFLTYILDGQQRIASIYACLKEIKIKEERYVVYFDLDKEEFIREREDDDEGRYVKFSDVFGKRHLHILRSLSEKRQEIFMQLHYSFMNYNFSTIRIKGQPIEIVSDIFERINNRGKKLTVVDLLVAKTWGPNFDLRKQLKYFTDMLTSKNYKNIDDRNILSVLSVIHSKKCHKKDILALTRQIIEEGLESVFQAIQLAIDFLKDNMNIKDSKILPYPAMIVPLAYLFYKNHFPSKSQIEETIKWFWQTGIASKYDEGLDMKIANDVLGFDRILGNQEFPGIDSINLTKEKIKSQRFSTGSAFAKTILCLYAYKNPKNFKNNLKVDINSAFSDYNSKEMHHIFPKKFLKKNGLDLDQESIANLCFIPSQLNKEWGEEPPSIYLRELIKENSNLKVALDSHLMNLEGMGLLEDDFNKFIDKRSELIRQNLLTFSGITKIILEDYDLKEEIIKIEKNLRILIKNKLEQIDRKWFKNPQFIEEDTIKKMITNLDRDKKINPNLTENDLWECLDLGTIIKILDNNQDKFQDFFKDDFIDYNFLVSLLRIINKLRIKELHGKNFEVLDITDVELIKIKIPIIIRCLNKWII